MVPLPDASTPIRIREVPSACTGGALWEEAPVTTAARYQRQTGDRMASSPRSQDLQGARFAGRAAGCIRTGFVIDVVPVIVPVRHLVHADGT